jgi:DNA (cytosine-5)-methyltransferase 1
VDDGHAGRVGHRPELGLARTVALRVLGNGVVPQQATAALRILLCPHRWPTAT